MAAKKIVLVIEDETPQRKALKVKLKDSGYDILEARDGVEGLEIALREHPDLIMLDLIMPRMSGQDMLEALREEEWGKTVPVIVLSNLNTADSVSAVLRQAAPDYFIKTDTSLQDIIQAIQNRIGPPDSETK